MPLFDDGVLFAVVIALVFLDCICRFFKARHSRSIHLNIDGCILFVFASFYTKKVFAYDANTIFEYQF